MGITNQTEAFMFDVVAATIVTEIETASYGAKPAAPELSWENKKKVEERYKRQEEIAAEQTKRLTNG